MQPVLHESDRLLVTAEWLHSHQTEVTVIGVRADAAAFTAAPGYAAPGADGKRALDAVGGHIAGARPVVYGELRSPRTIDGRTIRAMYPDGAALQKVLRAAGVDGGKPLVIVSSGDSLGALDMATRLYWTLGLYGSREVAVLNGGLAGWLEAGYPVSTAPVASRSGNWTAQQADLRWLADSNDAARAAEEGVQLVDARPVDQYLGITVSSAVTRGGHIAGARNLPPAALVRQRGLATYFMDAAAYAVILPQLGIDAGKPAITYCNTGHYASGAWFVLHAILGNKNARLYDGSMHEWTAEGRPVVPAGGVPD